MEKQLNRLGPIHKNLHWKSMSLLWRKDIPPCPSSFPDIRRLERVRSLSPMRPSTKLGYGLQEHPMD